MITAVIFDLDGALLKTEELKGGPAPDRSYGKRERIVTGEHPVTGLPGKSYEGRWFEDWRGRGCE